jgi:hypothetical protein
MAIEIATLATATAKLIGLGVGAVTAMEHRGWGKDHAKLFGDAIGSIPAFSAVAKGKTDDQRSPLQAYCELVTAAFGEAWRRHWAYDERLAPKASKSRMHAWLTSTTEQARTEQLEQALKSGRFESALEDATPHAEVELLGSLADPITSPWFRAPWAAFWAEDNSGKSADSPLPPLMLWQQGQEGASRREFERFVRAAFYEGLAADKFRTLSNWLLTRPEEQARLVRIMLAVRLSSFRTDHNLRNIRGGFASTALASSGGLR